MHNPALSVHIVLFLLAALVAGCAPTGQLCSLTPGEGPQPIKIGDIIETSTGRIISVDELISELSDVQIVYVGETHTSTEDHRVQLEVAKGLYAKNPSLILAMEMFPRSAQPALDRYTRGATSEEEFLKESDWETVWGFPFELYRDLLVLAHDKHLRVLGLNIPPGLSRKISRSGLSSLTPDERSKVAEHFNFDDSEHRKYILEEFQQHARHNIKGFETFYEAQLAWEETMAETLARALQSFKDHEQIEVIIGKGHINYKFGVPKRVWYRVPHKYRTIISLPIDYSGQMFDSRLADYVWVTKPNEPAPRGRLGITISMAPSGEGLQILSVEPDSPAEKAGLREGDILLKIDGTPLKSIEQIQRAVAQKARVHELTVRRGGRDISVTVFIP